MRSFEEDNRNVSLLKCLEDFREVVVQTGVVPSRLKIGCPQDLDDVCGNVRLEVRCGCQVMIEQRRKTVFVSLLRNSIPVRFRKLGKLCGAGFVRIAAQEEEQQFVGNAYFYFVTLASSP